MDTQKIYDHFVTQHRLVLTEKEIIAICNVINEAEQGKTNNEENNQDDLSNNGMFEYEEMLPSY